MTIKIGILGLQGDLEEHTATTKVTLTSSEISGDVELVKRPEQVEQVDGMIISGGESTVMGGLALFNGVIKSIRERVLDGMPVLGTCAGLILLSSRTYDRVVGETKQPLLGVLDVLVERNAFGRQRESFEADIEIPVIGDVKFRGVFIRSPLIKETGSGVKVLSKLVDGVVAVQQDNIIGTCFHPELTSDTRLHEYFLSLVKQKAS